jgi:hypothetical protein
MDSESVPIGTFCNTLLYIQTPKSLRWLWLRGILAGFGGQVPQALVFADVLESLSQIFEAERQAAEVKGVDEPGRDVCGV